MMTWTAMTTKPAVPRTGVLVASFLCTRCLYANLSSYHYHCFW